jgi:hypothetical protein
MTASAMRFLSMILFLAFWMIRCRHSLMPKRKIAMRQARTTANRAFAGELMKTAPRVADREAIIGVADARGSDQTYSLAKLID